MHTCKVCEKFVIDIDAATEEQRGSIEQMYNEHKGQANAAFNMLRTDMQHAKDNLHTGKKSGLSWPNMSWPTMMRTALQSYRQTDGRTRLTD